MHHWHVQDNAAAVVVGIFSGITTAFADPNLIALGERLALAGATALVTGFLYRLGSWGASRLISRSSAARVPVERDSTRPPRDN